jgi:hypothetical protein
LSKLEQLGKRKQRCQQCGAALWQQVPFKYGGRVAIADFLNRRYSGRYHLILDEAHHTKGADTDVGYASADLVSGAQKVIAMTGTIYAGKASSIFYLMYRMFPHFRQLYGYNEVQRFIDHHGLQETITTIKSNNHYHSAYGYNRENVRVRELPGCTPSMITLLLGNTGFIKLADMDLHLPEYSEERLPIPLDERLTAGLNDIAGIYDDATRLAREGQPGLLSAWLYASLGWMDSPVDETLKARNAEGDVIASHEIQGILSRNDQLLAEPLAKDQALVELVESELAQSRGVGVFFAQVNRRDWMARIQKMLKKKGIYSEILRQNTCQPEEREAWYRDLVQRCRAQGQEPVLLANGSLVKEGLDLIELPTLIEPVKVIFLYYEDSWQETALQLVAAKLKAALMVDGDLAEGLAAMDVDDGNLMDALMSAVAQGRPQPVLSSVEGSTDWAGMEIAAVAKPVPDPQPVLLPEVTAPVEYEVEIVQVERGGGAVQLSWGDLTELPQPKAPVQLPTTSRKPRPKRPPMTFNKVQTKGGGEQYAFC